MTTAENGTAGGAAVITKKMHDNAIANKNAAAAAAKFHHPYTPYDVQMQFMKAVYDVCEQGEGQVGILESPTGTGKSLSLICGALTWLRQHKRRQHEASLGEARAKFQDEPDWVVEQMLRQRRAELASQWERREARLAAARRGERAAAAAQAAGGPRGAKRRRVDGARTKIEDEEDEFLIGDDTGVDDNDRLSWFSKETRAMMEKAGLVTGKKGAGNVEEEEEDGIQDDIKIYYTSRTHSQLTQFIAELRRPQFPSSLPEGASKTKESEADGEPIKHVPLSSRQRLCINPGVSRLGSVAAINDRCAELQMPKKKSDSDSRDSKRCQYMLTLDNKTATHQFRDTALATLPDIEDLFQLGKTLHVCPYYASRTAVPGAEIITLPYPLLLQREAREALGINLDRSNSIVIVDEAHNIMDAVASVHAAAITLRELRRARKLLEVYVRRFGKKLKGESRVSVGQLGRVIQGLSAWLEEAMERGGDSQGIVDPSALLKHKGADQINLFSLVKYIQASKLAYKVESYAAYVEEDDNTSTELAKVPSPVLHTLTSFLLALTNLSSEGRIFFEKLLQPSTSPTAAATSPDIKLSYLLLSPTHAFSSIAASARAVILAGGTMSPFADYRMHLFPQLPSEKITTLSCGHVIPAENLSVWTLGSMRPAAAAATSAPGATPPSTFDFSFQKRSSPSMVRDLGMALLNLCTIVPDGVVVFFPSYGYLDEVVKMWQGGGGTAGSVSGPTLWDRLQAKKAVFRETRGGSSDEVLAAYAEAVLGPPETPTKKAIPQPQGSTARGALLLSVVGGKMSEGINFADRLGRCVVIVGLPFPNLHSPEWKARMEYVEDAAAKEGSAGATTPTAGAAGREFYENACMRAVNQSIGRAIRHRGDYAAIVLADRRFATERIRSKLPAWICAGMVSGSQDKGLSGMMAELGGFFRGKREEGIK